MPTVLPPNNGADGPGFNPWDDNNRNKIELLPIVINTPSGDFTFELPAYYAGAFEALDSLSSDEVKKDFEEALANYEKTNESIFFNDTLVSTEEIEVHTNDSGGNYLLFFALENFSNPELKLTDKQKEQIKKECAEIYFINEFSGPAKDIHKANAYFLLLCKLLSIQEKADKIPDSNPLATEHKELVDKMVSNYIGSMDILNDMSEISILPRKHFESLIKSDMPSGLQKRLWEIVTPSRWKNRTRQFAETISKARIETLQSNSVAKDAKLTQQLFEKLTRLENAIKPNTKVKRNLWENPFESLVSALEGKETVVYIANGPFKGGINDLEQNEAPNILRFQIQFLKKAAEKGFKNWILTGAFTTTLATICGNLKNTGDELSLVELKEKVEMFLDPIQNKSDEDLRDFMLLDKRKKVSNTFNHAITFVNAIRKISANSDLKIKLFQHANDDAEMFTEWLNSDEEKKLVFGENLIYPTSNELFILHSNLTEDTNDRFYIAEGIANKTKDVANQGGYGWGKDKSNSVCIPIEGNDDILALRSDEDLFHYENHSTQVCSASEKSYDFMIITKEGGNDDGNDEVEVFDSGPTVRSSGPLITV